jgi:hypothetical protein
MTILGKYARSFPGKILKLWSRGFLPAMAMVFLGGICRINGQTTNAIQLKAVFLSNFPQYMDWPAEVFADARAPLIIGILGKDPFGDLLDDAVRAQRVNNHPLLIERFKHASDVKVCQILYISDSETRRLSRILAELKGRSILTVSDMADFAPRGGMVCLSNQSNSVQLQVNLGELNAARLTMSSKLLRAADIVTTTNSK